MNDKRYNLFKYLLTILKWKKLLCINAIVIGVVAVILSFILPKWYNSSTTIIIPSKEGAELGLSSFIKKMPISGLNMGLESLSEDASLYVAIIKSRKTLEAVINRFDLIKRFKNKNIEDALKDIADYYSVTINEDGTISLCVSAKTSYFPNIIKENEAKLLSRDMAVYFIQQLDQTNKQLKIEKARNNRIFLEKRYTQALAELKQKEEEFKNFQQRYNTIVLTEQTTATIKVIAELKAQMIVKEIEINALRKSVGDSNIGIKKLLNELHALENQYNDLMATSGKLDNISNSSKPKDILLAFGDMPELGVMYARLVRDVMIQEKVIEFILPQYEQAKFQEAKDTPTLQILDEAQIPILKYKPKRLLLVLVFEIMAALIGLLFIFICENIQILNNEKNPDYLQIKKELGLNAGSKW
jgi:tyrosine-protein kinase Etk/Wzc